MAPSSPSKCPTSGCSLSPSPPLGLYISPRGLANLSTYKYSSGLSSYLDKEIMTPFWNYVVELMPMWVAPNLITVISLTHAFATHFMLQYYSPNFNERAPRIVYLFGAICMFLYQTLDAVDGKQARRTCSSSPLGQLFDHGCDAVCAVLTGIFMAATVQFGASLEALLVFFTVIVPFFVSNWEESCTGVMRFGIVGVTEGQFVVMAVLMFSSIAGPDIWDIKLGQQLIPNFAGFELRWAFLTIGLIGAFYQCVSTFISVPRHYWSRNQSCLPAFAQLLQFILMISLTTLWTLSPSSLYSAYPRVILLNSGLMMCTMVSRLIIAHHTEDEYPVPFYFMYLYPIVVANSWVGGKLSGLIGMTESELMWVWFVFILIMYLHFITVTINQITSSLGISCFVIKKRA